MKTKRTNWSTHETFGGTPLISRGSGKAFAATDHCVALVKTCPRCFERFMATPTKQDHDCATAVTRSELIDAFDLPLDAQLVSVNDRV